MKSYREIIAWQKSMDLVTDIYKNTESFPMDEKFGLTDQIRRASVSIPSNIAEGFGRNSLTEFIRFINIARGSLYEVQTQLEIGSNLGFMEKSAFYKLQDKTIEIDELTNGLVKSLKMKISK